jgi:hypothetical protein
VAGMIDPIVLQPELWLALQGRTGSRGQQALTAVRRARWADWIRHTPPAALGQGCCISD